MEFVQKKLEAVGLLCYPVGNCVKSLRTCNFCKGSEQEGIPVAMELNERISGKPVPVTLRPAYTGCAIGCGEPLVNDMGVMKIRNGYNLYIGRKAKGLDTGSGIMLMEQVKPEKLDAAVDKIIGIYAEHEKKREHFFNL